MRSVDHRGRADCPARGQLSVWFGGWAGPRKCIQKPLQLSSQVVSLKPFLLVFSSWRHIQRLAFPSPVRGGWLVCLGPGEASLSHLWEQDGQGLLIKYLAPWESVAGFECSLRPPASIYTLYPNQFGQNQTWGVTALLCLELFFVYFHTDVLVFSCNPSCLSQGFLLQGFSSCLTWGCPV